MREIPVSLLTEKIKQLIFTASYEIGADVEHAIQEALKTEQSEIGRNVLCQLCENYQIAKEERVAICQDTGMAVIFIDVGQDVHFSGGSFEEAIHEGVRQAYAEGYLRKSVVKEPIFDRKNTGDNTPAVIHARLVPGDQVHILITCKGFGSENMSALKMLVPADGVEGVKKFIVETAEKAGPNPCPPMVIGVGIGGTMEQAALMAKRMTARPPGQSSPSSPIRSIGKGCAFRHQRPGHRPCRHRRQHHRPCRQYRLCPYPYRRPACGRQHLLPRRPACRGNDMR